MIHGRLTRLRRIEMADTGLLMRWQSDPDVTRRWSHPTPILSPAEVRHEADQCLAESDSALHLLIEALDGRPVGRLDIERIDARHRSADIMLSIGDPTAQEEDVGLDAVAAACRYLFARRALHRVGLTVMVGDTRAVTLWESLGFRREGTLRGILWMDGVPVDEVAMSLLAGELRDIG